jgi:hypothetical protein
MSTILDPANVAGKRKGGMSMQGLMDPGGAIVKKYTGSDIASKVADPLSLYKDTDLTASKSEKKMLAAIAKDGQLEASSILTTSLVSADHPANPLPIFNVILFGSPP